MTTTPIPPQAVVKREPGETTGRRPKKGSPRAALVHKRLTSRVASGTAVLIAILWTVPTFGLLVTSFREPADINSSGWWSFLANPSFTLGNYKKALFDGSTNLSEYFINSLVITVPAVVIPISLALLAAYAFAWVAFPGRNILFIAVFALQVVPIQVTLVPLLTQFVSWGIGGSFWPVWIAHSMFALPLAVFLLHNFMRDIPQSLVEAARVDGAGHVTIFFKVVLPLLVPAIAAFAIFQFLWVWNDLLVGLVFGSARNVSPLTVRVAELAGNRGETWHLLSAGAFISMIVPVIVFLALQRYFVRGLLAGSVKG